MPLNRRLVPAVTAVLAAGLVATMATGAADAADAATASPGVAAATPARTTSPTTTPPATSTPSKDRGVVVAISRDAPSTVSLARGFAVTTIFSVSLYENLSTGYSWAQSVPAGSAGPVTLLDTDYVQDPAPPGWVGGGGTRYFRYRVTSAGDTTVTFLYRRPWETGIPPMKQVTLTLHAG